jgi:hypothetical protein
MSRYTVNSEHSTTLPELDAPFQTEEDENLTIAEHLTIMVAPNGHRKGERCFFNDRGERRWVAESEVARFLRKHGNKYPADFYQESEMDWKNNFFSGF